MLKSITKTITNLNFNTINYCEIQFKRFLVIKSKLKKTYYLLIPSSNIEVYFLKNKLHLIGLYKESEKNFTLIFNQFYNLLVTCNKTIKTLFKKQLIIKGLGFRVTCTENLITLKLGFSHLCTLEIPTGDISVYATKKSVTVLGFDKSLVGNFVNKIRSLKTPDSYKGKGFWYRYERENLKEVKKK